MVDFAGILSGIAGLGAAAVVTYYVVMDLIPRLEEVIADYIGDEKLATLLANFGVIYIGLVGIDQMASALRQVELLYIDRIGRIVGSAAGPAANIIGQLKWFIWIGVLIYIGTRISQLQDE